jgi:molecular chaperone GrpE
MKEDNPSFESPVGYGELSLDSEGIDEGSNREPSQSPDPEPEGPSTGAAGETEPPPKEPATNSGHPSQGEAASPERDEAPVVDEAADGAASEVAADWQAMSEAEHISRDAGEQPPPASDAESPDGDAESAVVEVIPPETPAEEQPRSRLGRRKKKGKDAKRADALRQPSQQEIFQRLMEKNEVILQLTKKNAELEARRKSLEDKRIQLLAEFENYRKRTRKEWDLLKQQTRAEVFVELVKIVDDFERAFAALGDQENEFKQGIRLIYNNMMALLASFGVTKMIALGQRFDPNYHMAVAHTDSPEFESNHVAEVVLDGYLMDGVLLRPASVVIAK